MAVIQLESPFKEKWRKGYLVINKEPRRNVILFNSNSDRTTISYAKYLMSVSLGRILNREEIVDHINGDKLDDRLENFQIICNRDNVAKAVIQNKISRRYVRYECVCGKIFERERKNSNLVPSLKNKQCYCSRRCSGLYSKKIATEFIEQFSIDPELDSNVRMD